MSSQETWGCSLWRKGGWEETSMLSTTPWKELLQGGYWSLFLGWQVIGYKEIVLNCTRGGLVQIRGRIFSQRRWSSIGRGGRGKWWNLHPQRCLRYRWTWTKRRGLVTALSRSDEWLHLIILKTFSDLSGSVINAKTGNAERQLFRTNTFGVS